MDQISKLMKDQLKLLKLEILNGLNPWINYAVTLGVIQAGVINT